MNNHNFLEVNESPIQKFILKDNKFESGIDEVKKLEQKPFIIVQPSPGICIKTKTEEGEKLFINICTSLEIPEPKDISEQQLISVLDDEITYSIPMSIGNERLEPDKDGVSCSTYDVMINARYFEKCQKSKSFLMFTVTVILDGVSNKFQQNINGSDNYTILKNRKVMGKLQPHRIENRQIHKQTTPYRPLIEEISKPPVSTNKNREQTRGSNKCSEYVILREPSEGVVQRLIGLFKIPKGIQKDDICLMLNSSRIVITIDKISRSYDLTVPFIIQTNRVEAMLDKNIQMLRLNMAYKGYSDIKVPLHARLPLI